MSSTTCLYHTSVTHGSLVKVRKRNAIIVTVLQLFVSTAGFAMSLSAYLFTSNIKVGSFWAQTVMIIAAIVILIGVLQNSEGKNWMVGGLFLCGIAIFAVVIGAIIDAVQAGYILNTDFSQCTYEVSAGSKPCTKPGCILNHGSRSCTCCKLHINRYCSGSVSLLNSKASNYEGVTSCYSVKTDFRNYLWSSCALCCASCIIGIVSCALVSLYKSAVSVTIVPIDGVTSRSILGASSPFIIFSNDQIQYNPSGPFPPPYSIAVGQPFPPAPATPTPPPSRNSRRVNHGAGTSRSASQSARSREQRRWEKRIPPYFNDYEDEPPPPYSTPPPPVD